MLKASLAQVAEWTGGTLYGEDARIDGACTDSRQVQAGQLFVALRGEHHDGHDHLQQARDAGAAAALVTHLLDVDLPQVCVTDTLLALGELARALCARSSARVIGITGSNGKTTVKNLTASILSRHGRTHVTAGNHNNEIGLPLTVLSMPEDCQFAVLEMGAGKPGDIEYLAGIAQPDVALVNNVAPAHLERMGSIEGVAQTKGAIYSALHGDGVAVINGEGEFAEYFAERAGARWQVRFGWQEHFEVHAGELEMHLDGSRFVLHVRNRSVPVHLALPGRHNVSNAMAAAAIACALDVPVETMVAGLEAAVATGGRLDARQMPGDWWLIDDSYNANPGSATAAIDTLMLHPGEHWLVLGDMAELGPDARDMHVGVGIHAHQAGVERVFGVGPLSESAVRAFGVGGQHFADREALLEALRDELHSGVVCLVKGSRSAAMEQVVAALQGGETQHAS